MAGGPRVASDTGAALTSPGDDVAATVTAGSTCGATERLPAGDGETAADAAGRDAAPAANVTSDAGSAVPFGASVDGSGEATGVAAGRVGAPATISVGLDDAAAGAVAAVGTAEPGVPADDDRTALAAASPSPDGAVAGVPVAGDHATTDPPAPGGSAEAGVLGVLAGAVPSAPPAAGDRTGTDAAVATAVAACCCGGTCAAFSAVGASSGRTAWAGVLGAVRCIPLSSENRSTARCAIASRPGTWSEAIQAAAQPAATTMTPSPTHAPLRSPPPDDRPSNSACARTRRDNSLTVWRSRSRSASLFTAAASSRSVTACCCSRRWRRASFSAVTVSNAASALATPAEMPSKPRERTNSASWRTAWRFFANWSNNASSSCSSIDGARSVLSAGKRHFMPSGARYWNRANCEIWNDPTAAAGPYPAASAHR